MKKILITGGLGYIGSHTVVEFIKSGRYSVVVVDNNSTSEKWIKNQIETITGISLIHYDFDLCDYEKLKILFETEGPFYGVVHFAAYKSVLESVKNPLPYYENNIISLLRLLKCIDEYKIKNFIFSSSCTVYGNPQAVPVTENSPLNRPESPYGMTKLMSEHILQDAVKSIALRVVSLRYFNPVGAHESALIGELPIGIPNYLVPFITQTAIGLREKLIVHGNDYPTRDGTCIRDYIYITDLAIAHVLALDYLQKATEPNGWHIFNLGSGNGVSVKEAISAFIKATGQPLKFEYGPRRAGDVIEIYANFDKAKSILGWTPKASLEFMMLTAWNWEKYMHGRLQTKS